MELWKGRFQKALDPKTNDFNSSISVDSRMYKEDIEGSIAHATMLGEAGIIEKSESEKICAGLKEIASDIESGALLIDPNAEDIHTFVEGELTARIGDAGKRLHTARSRNDQVALDVRLVLKKECASLVEQIRELLFEEIQSLSSDPELLQKRYDRFRRIGAGETLLAESIQE